MITGSTFQQLPDKLAGSQAAEKSIPKLGRIISAVTSGQVGQQLEYAYSHRCGGNGTARKANRTALFSQPAGWLFFCRSEGSICIAPKKSAKLALI
ncbi:MAG: hypothetical protein IKX47_09020, partial [Oscillospiraceae bacterium]|nr:hypothetical protein [Oscillospiraceae bacterium]